MLRRIAIGALIASTTTVARADKEEASLHLELIGGVARLGDPASPSTTTAPMFGLATRFGYGLSDWYQLDGELTFASTAAAHFASGTFNGPNGVVSGPFSLTQQLARADAGLTFRFGVRYIPTLRFALGAELRRTSPPTGFVGDVRGQMFAPDLTARVAVGLDVRRSARTVIGISVGATYGVPLGGASFGTIDVTLSYARYHYPRW